jgi:hypothetical protein
MPPVGEALRVQPKPQGHNSLWLETRELRGVTTQVFHFPSIYLYTYIYTYIHIKTYFTAIPSGKIRKNRVEERQGG